jgi:hypothetical protein
MALTGLEPALNGLTGKAASRRVASKKKLKFAL